MTSFSPLAATTPTDVPYQPRFTYLTSGQITHRCRLSTPRVTKWHRIPLRETLEPKPDILHRIIDFCLIIGIVSVKSSRKNCGSKRLPVRESYSDSMVALMRETCEECERRSSRPVATLCSRCYTKQTSLTTHRFRSTKSIRRTFPTLLTMP